VKIINKTIRESDVVIIDLNTTPVYEAELIVNQLKDNFNVNTTVVLLSTLMTWFNTPNNETAGDTPEEEGEVERKQDDEDKGEDMFSLVKEL